MQQWRLGKEADKTWEKSPGQIVSDADIAVSYNRIWCLEEFEVWGVPC